MSTSKILDLEALAFVYALAFIVFHGLLTSRINMKGLLLDKSGSGTVRPERVQLMIATLVMAAKYLTDVFSTTTPTFPHIDATWLYLFGGSNGIYVTRKLYERLKATGQ